MWVSAFDCALRRLVLAGPREKSLHDEDSAQSRRSSNSVYAMGPVADEAANSLQAHRRL